MTLKTWSFAKKHNSTAQPVGASRDYTVYMKEDTSIERPVFILGTGINADINYCQWSGNYYFIDDIVLISADQVELHCSLDALATHKTAIGNYTCFVERAAAANDPYIIDDALSVHQKIISSAVQTNALWDINQTGCFVVRTVGDAGDATGISSWVLTAAELSALLGNAFDENNPDYADIMVDQVVKSFFNPFQYIVSCMWFPYSKDSIKANNPDNMQMGFWPMGSYYKLKAGFDFDSVDLTIPTNYYSGDFRAYHPNFTTLKMFLPGVGVIGLDPIILSHEHITAYTCIDFTTGNINIRLQYRDSLDSIVGDIGSYSGQVGVPIPVAQINNVSQGLTNIADQASFAIAEGASIVGSMIEQGGATTIGGVVRGVKNALQPGASILGNSGNMATMISNPRLITSIINYGCGEFPNVVYGKPLCRNRKISTLSGYIKCANASIPLAAPDTEIEAVNNYLNSGFYYE